MKSVRDVEIFCGAIFSKNIAPQRYKMLGGV